MKYIISLFCILNINLSCQENCNARLIIKTDNDLAFVIINDTLTLRGRRVEVDLPGGTYFLVIGEDSDRWNAETFYDTLNLIDCDTVNKSYNFNQGTMIDSHPQDAYVYSGDKLIGHTPLRLPSGINMITLKKPDYEETQYSVSGLNNYEKIDLIYTGRSAQRIFIETPLFKYLVSSLLVFGGITAYYKIEADNKFTGYQLSGSEDLLKETRRYDTISGISFAVLQINFGLLLYFLLSD